MLFNIAVVLSALLSTGSAVVLRRQDSSTMYLNPSTFRDSCLEAHNGYRSHYGAGPVRWSPKLVAQAQQAVLRCEMKHSKHNPYGENLAEGFSDPQGAVDDWMGERQKPQCPGSTSFDPDCGHYTQVVWKGTTKIGCAANDCGSSGWLFACEYDTPGNMEGDYEDNTPMY